MAWLRPAVSIVLLAVLYALVDLDQVIATLRAVNTGALACALLLFALSTILFTTKWRACLPAARFKVLLRSLLSSMFFFLLPTGTLGAEASKLSVARSERLSIGAVAGSVAFDKLTGLSALALIGGLAGLLSQSAWMRYASAPLLLTATAAFALSMHGHAVVIAVSRFLPSGALARKVATVASEWDEISRLPGLAWKTALLGTVAQAVVVGIYACLATGLGIDCNLPELAVCVVIANLISILPITVAGIGARELGLVAMLARTGVDPNAGASLTVAAFGVFLVGSAAGFINLLLPADSPVER